jgi:hypothetical protein
MTKLTRDYAIDWLRVLATLAVFVFHSGAPFAAGDWHLNAPNKSFPITVWNAWLLLWIMPLLFCIAGASTFFSLQTRPTSRFLGERVNRLLVPLLFGILVVVPPQVYIERISRNQFAGAFWAFYPHYFDGWYLAIGGPGNFAWMGLHLWFLLLLFLLTLLALPLLRWWQAACSQPGLDSLTQQLDQPERLLLLALPLAVIEWLWGNVGLGGWHMLTYPLFFLYGAFLFALRPMDAIFRRAMGPALVGALITTVLLFVTVYGDGMVAFGQYPHGWQRILHAVSGWCWVVAWLGLAYRWLTVRTPFLTHANEAVLPFYILHQTVIILVGYAVSQSSWPIAVSYGGVLVGSLLGIFLLYVGLIRQVSILRLLFGLKA